jgi:hypothetical protein
LFAAQSGWMNDIGFSSPNKSACVSAFLSVSQRFVLEKVPFIYMQLFGKLTRSTRAVDNTVERCTFKHSTLETSTAF